jgi:Tetratricopeptide repeat
LTAALLPAIEQVLGTEHPETMSARNNLAHLIGVTGNRARARYLYAELLADAKQVLGDQHPETVLVGRRLAYWTRTADEGSRP